MNPRWSKNPPVECYRFVTDLFRRYLFMHILDANNIEKIKVNNTVMYIVLFIIKIL